MKQKREQINVAEQTIFIRNSFLWHWGDRAVGKVLVLKAGRAEDLRSDPRHPCKKPDLVAGL